MGFEIFEKEYDIANMKIDSYFENTLSNYIAIQEVYGESVETNDLKFVIESEDSLNVKIKKVFVAIIEAIKQFVNKIYNTIQAKIRELKVKMTSRKIAAQQIQKMKMQLKAGKLSKIEYKRVVDLIKTINKMDADYVSLHIKYSGKIKSARSTDEVNRLMDQLEFDATEFDKKYEDAADFLGELTAETKAYLGAQVNINDLSKMDDLINKAADEADAIINKLEAEARKCSGDAAKVNAFKRLASNVSASKKFKVNKIAAVIGVLVGCVAAVFANKKLFGKKDEE